MINREEWTSKRSVSSRQRNTQNNGTQAGLGARNKSSSVAGTQWERGEGVRMRADSEKDHKQPYDSKSVRQCQVFPVPFAEFLMLNLTFYQPSMNGE